MSYPLVSILLAVHNGADTLHRCLTSICEQTYQDWELIIVDDASHDTSQQIILAWQREQPTRSVTLLFNATNLGLTQSINRALATAAGSYIARIDADDWWHVNKLAKQVNFLLNNHTVGIVGSWYQNMRSTRTTTIRLPVSDSEIKQSIFWRNPFGHSCVVMRRSILELVGGYDTRLRYGQDRDLWFRLLPITAMANLPEVLCYRTVNGPSTTRIKAQMWQQCKTLHKYIKLYGASRRLYLSLWLPGLMLLTPDIVRRNLRLLYDHFSAH